MFVIVVLSDSLSDSDHMTLNRSRILLYGTDTIVQSMLWALLEHSLIGGSKITCCIVSFRSFLHALYSFKSNRATQVVFALLQVHQDIEIPIVQKKTSDKMIRCIIIGAGHDFTYFSVKQQLTWSQNFGNTDGHVQTYLLL